MKCCRHCVPPKRYPGCHDHCPDYIEERAEFDELKAIEEKKKAVRQSIYNQKSRAVTRALKRHGGNKKMKRR